MKLLNSKFKIQNLKFKIFLLFTIHYSLFAIHYATAQNNITIKGKISNNPYKTIFLDKYEKKSVVLDSAKIANTGEFILNAKITETGFFMLRLTEGKTLMLILTPGEKIDLTANYSDLQTPTSLSGSYQTGLALDLSKKLTVFDKKNDSLNKVYENSSQKDLIVNDLRNAYAQFSGQQKQILRNFILHNLNTLSGLMFINTLPIDGNFDVYFKYDSALTKTYPNNSFVHEFDEQVQKNVRISVGNIAPDIVEKDTLGKNKALSSFRGKYVLIDFWASWCGPCRRESPNMVKLYKKYHDKGFEIFSVSLDKDKNSWLTAIRKDNLKWTHVSDLGYWNAAPAKMYNVTSIPYTILLDKTGKILAKGLSGSQIDERLQQLLK